MKRFLYSLTFLFVAFATIGCTEDYAKGERIGLVTQFSQAGLVWKSWEGHLNLTQTGMNSASSTPFDFSVDNDKEDPEVVRIIKAAADSGWKVKLTYHQVLGYNWFSNRGETNHFITGVEVLDKNPTGFLHNVTQGAQAPPGATTVNGRTVDTVYVVIVGTATQGFKYGK